MESVIHEYVPGPDEIRDSTGYVGLVMPFFHEAIQRVVLLNHSERRQIIQQLVAEISEPQRGGPDHFFVHLGKLHALPDSVQLERDKTHIFTYQQVTRLLSSISGDKVPTEKTEEDVLIVLPDDVRAAYLLLIERYPPEDIAGRAFWRDVAMKFYVQLPGWAHPEVTLGRTD